LNHNHGFTKQLSNARENQNYTAFSKQLLRTTSVHTHKCMYLCMHVYMYVYMHVYVCMYTSLNTGTLEKLRMHGRILYWFKHLELSWCQIFERLLEPRGCMTLCHDLAEQELSPVMRTFNLLIKLQSRIKIWE
jgi:hypothetical protein